MACGGLPRRRSASKPVQDGPLASHESSTSGNTRSTRTASLAAPAKGSVTVPKKTRAERRRGKREIRLSTFPKLAKTSLAELDEAVHGRPV